MNQSSIPAVWMRGGTSKGLILMAGDLPNNQRDKDQIICRIFGSPDLHRTQMNGMGGGTSSTSLVSIVNESEQSEYDLEYISGNVSIDTDVVDYSGFSANLSAAVGVFAVEQGIVIPNKDGPFKVNLLQANINRKIVVHLQIENQQPVLAGDYSMNGVSGSGAPIRVEIIKPGLGKTGRPLTNGKLKHLLDIPGYGVIEVSLISAGGNTVFVKAESLGLQGTEFTKDIESRRELLNLLELIRCIGAVEMGVSPSIEFARSHQPSSPKVVILCSPKAYVSTQGKTIDEKEQSFCARMLSMGRVHHAFTGTAAIAAGVAAQIPGTTVHDCLNKSEQNELSGKTQTQCRSIKIGHPGGIFEVEAEVVEENGFWVAKRASIIRTARTLMIGEAFYESL